MTIPELHLPTENANFIENPYIKMGEIREETRVVWHEEEGVYVFTR